MAYKNRLFNLFLGLLLVSCNVETNLSEATSSSYSESVENDVSSNECDYSLFDDNIVGTWYVHQGMCGLANINDEIIIKDNYTATFMNIDFSYVGIYEGFEGTCLFRSAKGTVDFVASCDDKGNLDWSISDLIGNFDYGYASKEKHISGIPYSYEGTRWPIENIKDYLKTSVDIPAFDHTYYYLYTGVSALYNDDIYCMIDLYGVSNNAKEEYTSLLENNGYIFTRDSNSFNIGYDSTKTYAIKLSQNNDNFCIFVYYYKTIFNNIN